MPKGKQTSKAKAGARGSGGGGGSAAASRRDAFRAYAANPKGPTGFGADQRVKGSERILTALYTGDVQTVDLDYIGLKDLRVAKLFELYEMRFVHSLRFEFVPIVSRTTAGTVHMAPEYDPADTAPAPDAAPVLLSEMAGYSSGPVSDKCYVHMSNLKLPCGTHIRPTLYNTPLKEERLSNFGRFYIYGDGVGVSGDAAYGHVIMHYDMTFVKPQHDVNYYVGTAGVTRLTIKGTLSGHARSVPISNSGGLGFQNNSASDIAVPVDETLTGIIDAINGDLSFVDALGKAIGPGTRIWARSCAYQDGGAGVGSHSYTNSRVGWFSTSRDFDPASIIYYMGTAASAYAQLRSVFRIGNKP